MSVQVSKDTLEKMMSEKPYKSYKKTILGQLYVNRLDPFTLNSEGVIIKGDPKKDDSCIIDVWSELEDIYLRRSNAVHFRNKHLVEYQRPEKPLPRDPNDKTEAEMEELLNSKFMAIQNELKKITSQETIIKLLTLAEALEKSDKIKAAINQRLTEIQQEDYDRVEE